jgi:bis(5'-nucleosidyl)-tetraphosphatase
MLRQFSAGIVVYHLTDSKREYLLLHYGSGHWDFAKGKIERGESKQQAALRELQEESGLTATIIPGFEHQLHYYFRQKHELIYKTVYFFTGETDSQDVTISHEHIGFKWLPYPVALNQLTYKNAQETLTAVEEFLNTKK